MSAFPSVGPSGEFNPSPIPDPSGKGPPLPHPSYAPLPSGMPAASNVPGSYTLVSGSPTAPVNNRLLLSPSNVPSSASATEVPTFSSKGSRTPSTSPSPFESASVTHTGSPSVDPFSASVTASLGPLSGSPPPPPFHPSVPGSFSASPAPKSSLAIGAPGLSPEDIYAIAGTGTVGCVAVLTYLVWRHKTRQSSPIAGQLGNVAAAAAALEMVPMRVNPLSRLGRLNNSPLSKSSAVIVTIPGNKSRNNKKTNNHGGASKKRTQRQRGGSIQKKLFALARELTLEIMANGGVIDTQYVILKIASRIEEEGL